MGKGRDFNEGFAKFLHPSRCGRSIAEYTVPLTSGNNSCDIGFYQYGPSQLVCHPAKAELQKKPENAPRPRAKERITQVGPGNGFFAIVLVVGILVTL